MVASTTAAVLASELEVRTVMHNPADAATAQLVDLGQPKGAGNLCLPIALFKRFLAEVTVSLLPTGTGLTAFSIYAATAADGTGGVAVVTHALGSLPNAVGDSVNLECSAENIYEVLPTATHVGVWLDCNHNDDEMAVTFIRGKPTFPHHGLTADYVS